MAARCLTLADMLTAEGEWLPHPGIFGCAHCGLEQQLTDVETRAPSCPACPDDLFTEWYPLDELEFRFDTSLVGWYVLAPRSPRPPRPPTASATLRRPAGR